MDNENLENLLEKYILPRALCTRILQSISEGISLIDRNYRILWANNALLGQTKYKIEEIVGELCFKATHHLDYPCSPPKDICPISEVLKTGKSITRTHIHFNEQGKKFFSEVTAYPVFNENNEIIQFVHIARDITEQIKVREEVKEKTNELDSVADAATGREIRLSDLEKEVDSLLAELERPAKYNK